MKHKIGPLEIHTLSPAK